jgi:hypothetical protein
MPDMNCIDANNLSIISYLKSLLIEPSLIKGNDYWYLSPFRVENTPSFKVNGSINRFFDHGIGEGGKLVDLALKLNPGTTLTGLLKKLDTNSSTFSLQQQQSLAPCLSNIEILGVGALQSSNLFRYLEQRGISNLLALEYCNEVIYRIRSTGNTYNSIGFINCSKGYELRSASFKGSTSPKDISLFTYDSCCLGVFEGWIDFLSWLTICFPQKHHIDYLVLNSVGNLKRSMELMEKYKTVFTFLDNDEAGKNALVLIRQSIAVVDCSILYSEYKDINDFLVRENH